MCSVKSLEVMFSILQRKGEVLLSYEVLNFIFHAFHATEDF